MRGRRPHARFLFHSTRSDGNRPSLATNASAKLPLFVSGSFPRSREERAGGCRLGRYLLPIESVPLCGPCPVHGWSFRQPSNERVVLLLVICYLRRGYTERLLSRRATWGVMRGNLATSEGGQAPRRVFAGIVCRLIFFYHMCAHHSP